MKLPKRLLKNHIELRQDHYEEIKAETAIERRWYEAATPYQTPADILAAAKDGKLAKVEATSDYLPILRFRNPKLIETYPPYLKPETKALLEEVCSRWRKKCDNLLIGKDIRLAISSLVMSETYRNELLKAGKLAIDKGPHVLGEAFDIDGCGYYVGEVPVNPRPKTQTEWDQAFGQMNALVKRPNFEDYSHYEKRVHEVLKDILDQMMLEGKLHYAWEYPGTINASFHICRHPDYSG